MKLVVVKWKFTSNQNRGNSDLCIKHCTKYTFAVLGNCTVFLYAIEEGGKKSKVVEIDNNSYFIWKPFLASRDPDCRQHHNENSPSCKM